MERLADFFSYDYFDKKTCEEISDDYESIIFRFFEGDIPMMVAQGDIASGTGKREAMSEAFTAHPFKYSLHPLPFSQDSPVFLNLYAKRHYDLIRNVKPDFSAISCKKFCFKDVTPYLFYYTAILDKSQEKILQMQVCSCTRCV
jgi:hypothetical protein